MGNPRQRYLLKFQIDAQDSHGIRLFVDDDEDDD